MLNKRRGHRNDLGSLFAASIVIVVGAAMCSILFLVGDPDASPWLIAAIAAVATLFLAVIIGVRFPKVGSGLGFWTAFFGTRTHNESEVDYEPRRLSSSAHASHAEQRPITADEARSIHLLSTSTWVPSGIRRRETRDEDQLN